MMGHVEHSTNTPRFTWDEPRTQAAISLANGATKQEVADEVGVDRTTIYNWLKVAEFSEEVDRLSLMVGIASRAERLRQAKRVLRSKMKDGVLQSDKDALEWLKFAQSETDGVKLDLGKLAASFAPAEAPVAGSGSSTGDTEPAATPATEFSN